MLNLNCPNSRKQYIENLDLFNANHLRSVMAAASEAEHANVVDGSTVSFVGGIPLIKQQDVLNSTLLAQLAANAQYDREKETIDWYDFYREVLVNLGWISASYNFELQNNVGNTIELDTKSLDIIASVAAGNELTLLSSTLDALENQDPNSKVAALFDSGGSSGAAGNFQLGVATLDQNQNVVLVTGAFYFEADRHEKRFLFVTWESKSINFYAGVQRVVLNEQIYATVREAVNQKLGDKAQTFVADLPI